MKKTTKVLALIAPLCLLSHGSAIAQSAGVFARGERQVRQLLQMMDADKNGQVSKAEFMRFMDAEFDRIDADRSGELTAKELSQFGARAKPHVQSGK